jgi:hypothetical protein
VPRSLRERWRERPRCRARHLTPGRPDGVVHAIAGRRPCRCLLARSAQEKSAACVSIRIARSDSGNVSMSSARIGSRASRVPLQKMTTVGARIELHHHRADDADAVLDVVNALRFAPTRPVAGPSGIDDASARHRWAMTRWWVDLMRRTTRLTTASRGRMLGSSPQCRTALLRFATTASGARIRPTLPGHGFERTLHDIAVGSQGLWRCRVLRTARATRRRSPAA